MKPPKANFVSLDTAKLAKEKGCYYEANSYYVEYLITKKSDNPSFRMRKGEIGIEHGYIKNNIVGDYSCESYTCYARLTLSDLQEWLIKNDIIVLVDFILAEQTYVCRLVCKENSGWETYVVSSSKNSKYYNDALEIGLVEGLKLHKIK